MIQVSRHGSGSSRGAEPPDHRSKSINVPNAEVRDSPAIPASFEVVGDLIVGSDGEKWRTERIVNAETRNLRSHLCGCLPPVISDHDGLNQDVQFQLIPAFLSLLSERADGPVEPLLFPADLVPLSVVEGATKHRETDDVGVAGRVSKSPSTVHTNEKGYVILL